MTQTTIASTFNHNNKTFAIADYWASFMGYGVQVIGVCGGAALVKRHPSECVWGWTEEVIEVPVEMLER